MAEGARIALREAEAVILLRNLRHRGTESCNATLELEVTTASTARHSDCARMSVEQSLRLYSNGERASTVSVHVSVVTKKSVVPLVCALQIQVLHAGKVLHVNDGSVNVSTRRTIRL